MSQLLTARVTKELLIVDITWGTIEKPKQVIGILGMIKLDSLLGRRLFYWSYLIVMNKCCMLVCLILDASPVVDKSCCNSLSLPLTFSLTIPQIVAVISRIWPGGISEKPW